ncbi:MAG: hypothetical protein COB54_06455 [Alphaproteobacteria bacterium]|nr:MAG: hypothetical protein COB54_06455 [Alphaproteobacteria bacterium]
MNIKLPNTIIGILQVLGIYLTYVCAVLFPYFIRDHLTLLIIYNISLFLLAITAAYYSGAIIAPILRLRSLKIVAIILFFFMFAGNFWNVFVFFQVGIFSDTFVSPDTALFITRFFANLYGGVLFVLFAYKLISSFPLSR